MIRNGTLIPIPQGLQSQPRRMFNRSIGRSFEAKIAQGETVIDIYDEIGPWGVTAAMVKSELRNAGDVRLRIHSPGGDVFDSIAIYNDLVSHPGNVNIEIPGLAASGASVIVRAGDHVAMASTAMQMMHNAWGMTVGDRHDHEDMTARLSTLDHALANVYESTTQPSMDEIVAMMDRETWLTAQEAIDLGFADEIIDGAEPKAMFDLSGFKNTPQNFKWSLPQARTAQPTTIRDFEQVLTRDAGLSAAMAKAILADGFAGARDAASNSDIVTRDADDWADALSTFHTSLLRELAQ